MSEDAIFRLILTKVYELCGLNKPSLVLTERLKTPFGKTAGNLNARKFTGAVRMDPETVDSWSDTLPKDKEIILYCA